MSNESHWQVSTADEITVELSSGLVVIDHEQREGVTRLANLNLVGRDVTATLHGLTQADLRAICVACFKFSYRLEAAAAEPSEPQESRQESGTGTDAQRDAFAWVIGKWYRTVNSTVAELVEIDTKDVKRSLALLCEHGRFWVGRDGCCVSTTLSVVAGPFDTEAEALAWSPEPEPEDNDGRMVPDELAALQAEGFAVTKAEPAETWGVLLDIDEAGRAFHVVGTREQAERWAYHQLCKSGGILEPNETEWREQLWEFIDDELEPGEMIEFCLLAKDLDERITAFLATHLPEQSRRALPSEVAAALCGDSYYIGLAAMTMDRLEAAGMKIIKE